MVLLGLYTLNNVATGDMTFVALMTSCSLPYSTIDCSSFCQGPHHTVENITERSLFR